MPEDPQCVNSEDNCDAQQERELTQTDHINKKLLMSLLQHMNKESSTVHHLIDDNRNHCDDIQKQMLGTWLVLALFSFDMSHLENIFLEEVDETADLENIENNEFAPEDNESNNENENEPQESGTKVQPKRRVIRNPQPKLDPERLRGPRGIAILEDFFKDFKYKGKGHEKEDLQYLMIRLEHWCHRLFPKYQYDDCLEKIEKLGSKKVVQTFVKKIRLGMVDTEQLNSQVIENDALPDTNDPADPFDLLLDQQLLDVSSKSKQNEAFDSLMQ